MHLRLKLKQFFCKHNSKVVHTTIERDENGNITTSAKAKCTNCEKDKVPFKDELIPNLYTAEKLLEEFEAQSAKIERVVKIN